MWCESRTLSQKRDGYCWPTPQYQNWCAQHAFFEGKKAEETFSRKSTPRTLKEVGQQYRDDFCMLFPSRCLRKLAGLPDHLVRLEEERRGYRQSEVLGGLEVDDQLELRGLLHGEVGGLGPLQDFIDIGGSA